MKYGHSFIFVPLTPHYSMNKTPLTTIIVAGGKGERMQSDMPKQFIELRSLPILMHTIRVFYDYTAVMKLIVVLPETQIENWRTLCKKHAFSISHDVVSGGQTRFESVSNGLALAGSEGIIAIHDGVRPLVSRETISRCFGAAARFGAAIPVMPPVESLRMITAEGSVAVDRNRFRMVQTPQVFRAEIIQKAYQQQFNPLFTDDASVVEHAGYPIGLVEGNAENIKITLPADLLWAENLIG
jgi:2-C-methyl-D-erythritol 4-phosphate cytidylyltransferase